MRRRAIQRLSRAELSRDTVRTRLAFGFCYCAAIVTVSSMFLLADAGATEEPGHKEGRFIFNFRSAPWDIVLKKFAEEADLSLHMNVVPPGTFDFLDAKSYTATEALDILNGDLIQSGYILLRKGRFLIAQSLEQEIPPYMIPQVQLPDIESRADHELVRVVLRLDNVNAARAAKEIEPVLSPLGRAVALDNSNHLVVTDLAGVVREVHRLLQLGESEFAQRPGVVIRLKNTPAEDVAKAINDFLSGRPSATALPNDTPSQPIPRPSEVVVIPEINTNSLIISAPPRYLMMLERLVYELDAPPAQVVIQALLVEVELDETDEFGIELGVQSSVLFDRSVISNLVTLTETATNEAGIIATNQTVVSQEALPGFLFNNAPLGNNTAIRPNEVGGQGLSNFALGRVNGDLGYGGLVLSAGSDSVSLLLRALSARRRVELLSRPQIRTIHNRSAQIQIGQQVPVVDGVSVTAVGSANPIIRQDNAGIILDVTPRINPDGTVVMDVTAEKSAFQLGPGSGVPIFTDATNGNVIEAPVKNITTADATVSVQDGQTIVLGGMIVKHTVDVEAKVPVLGNLPGIGWLFRHDLQQIRRRELLIFLTPRVIRDAWQSDAITAEESGKICLPHDDVLEMHGPLVPYEYSPADAMYDEQQVPYQNLGQRPGDGVDLQPRTGHGTEMLFGPPDVPHPVQPFERTSGVITETVPQAYLVPENRKIFRLPEVK